MYGMLIHDTPLILANIIPLACNVMLTLLKLHYRNDGNAVQKEQ
jgi:MtN3 and saliva related transmembrane protein